jgi:hypothetical protein
VFSCFECSMSKKSSECRMYLALPVEDISPLPAVGVDRFRLRNWALRILQNHDAFSFEDPLQSRFARNRIYTRYVISGRSIFAGNAF